MTALLKEQQDPLVPTIFHEPWWLDIATKGRYEVAEVIQDGRVVGRLPYNFSRKAFGLLSIGHPPLTHFMGPAIVDCVGKSSTVMSYRYAITEELIRRLPDTTNFYMKFHRGITDLVAFQAAGFSADVQFTHEIHPQPTEELWSKLRDKTRNLIRTAGKRYTVSAGTDPEAFMHYYAECIKKTKGQENKYDLETHAKLIGASIERGCGKIYEAKNEEGSVEGAIYCAWDKGSSYYLLTCRTPSAHGGCTALLLWNAICDAFQNDKIFDFDGFTNSGTLRSAKNFSTVITPRYCVRRETSLMRIYNAIKPLLVEESYFCR